MTLPPISRRRFIQLGTGSTVGLAMTSLPGAEWLFNQSDSVTVGVIGLGRRGLQHLAMYRRLPAARVAWLCENSESVLTTTLRDASERASGLRATQDYRRLLEDDRLEAVSITVPFEQQSDLIRSALESGKSVLVEIPWMDADGNSSEISHFENVHNCLLDFLAEPFTYEDITGIANLIGTLRSAVIHTQMRKVRKNLRSPSAILAAGIHTVLRSAQFTNDETKKIVLDRTGAFFNLELSTGRAKLEFERSAGLSSVEVLASHDVSVSEGVVELVGTRGRARVRITPTRNPESPLAMVEFLNSVKSPGKAFTATCAGFASAILAKHMSLCFDL